MNSIAAKVQKVYFQSAWFWDFRGWFCRTVTPEAAGSSPVHPATLNPQDYKEILRYAERRIGLQRPPVRPIYTHLYWHYCRRTAASFLFHFIRNFRGVSRVILRTLIDSLIENFKQNNSALKTSRGKHDRRNNELG